MKSSPLFDRCVAIIVWSTIILWLIFARYHSFRSARKARRLLLNRQARKRHNMETVSQ
jgi:hypothetical protein